MTKEEFYQKWNPGGTFNNPYSERDKDILDNANTYREFMDDLKKVIEAEQRCNKPPISGSDRY